MTDSCGAGSLAKTLLEQLTDGETFPTSPPAPITRPTIGQLTEAKVNGSGVFDIIMASLSAHLKAEYAAGRITGAEYAKAWISSSGAALQSAVQFLTAVDNSYWQALTAKATFALTTMKLATEDASYCATLEQKLLYRQQIESYKRNSEAAAAKMMTDLWATYTTTSDSDGTPHSL